MTDDLMDRGKRVDPLAPTEFDDWSRSAAGRRLLAEIVAQKSPTAPVTFWRRRRLMLPAAAAVSVLAAAGYAVTSREVKTPAAIACASTFSQSGDMTIVERVEGRPATATCISEMSDAAWNPPPSNPVECVTNYPGGDGGALLVVPAPDGMSQEDACAVIGAAVPEDEG